jgi:hypothetical protein
VYLSRFGIFALPRIQVRTAAVPALTISRPKVLIVNRHEVNAPTQVAEVVLAVFLLKLCDLLPRQVHTTPDLLSD